MNLVIQLEGLKVLASHSIPGEIEIRNLASYGRNSGGTESSGEFNRLSVELNQRITQEMDELMSSAGIQIQRAISEAINEQVLPQFQASLKANSGQMTQKGQSVPPERPERRSEETYSQKVRSRSRSELPETDFVTKIGRTLTQHKTSFCCRSNSES